MELSAKEKSIKSLTEQCSMMVYRQPKLTRHTLSPPLLPPSLSGLQKSLITEKNEKLLQFSNKLSTIKAGVRKELEKVRERGELWVRGRM